MIEVNDLQKFYEDFSAVSSLTFNVYPGEIFGIIGPNGAGKSTTLKMLIGLIKPTSGTIKINGLGLSSNMVEIKSILGFLPEDSTLYENMEVEEYLLFFSELYGLDKKDANERIFRLLTDLSLNPYSKKIGDLSKGMKRKVAIARSLINEPDILVYDEPGSGLDPMTSNFITEYIGQLKNEGKTIVFSAHNLYQMDKLCDRILIIKDGKQKALGSPGEIKKQYSNTSYRLEFVLDNNKDAEIQLKQENIFWRDDRYVLLTENIETVNSVTKKIITSGGKILEMSTVEPTLEDIFLRIVSS
ncbi:ABC transporter ATP-binding protein [Methanosalsum natronophilum]|uniref:ABC transporter ATP-binding protein n=1 Tax=Methanosalsum natronophilum TaxID=768733 RepID=UPI00216951C7|nr:ABC transporter ATP-binding protein [Methanosalsum natronophilum]